MNTDAIKKDKNGSIRLGLVGAAVLLASLAGAKVARCVVEPKRAEGFVAYASAWTEEDPNRVQPYLDGPKDVADELKKKNLFVKAPPPQHPVKQVDGILGSEVLIGDKWYKAGDKIGEARIVAVASTQVTIEWEGKDKTFAPLASAGEGPPRPPGRPAEKPKPGEKPDPAKAAKEKAVSSVAVVETSEPDDPLAWLGVDLPPAFKAKLVERWNSASEEERAQAMQQWNRMSSSEREQALEGMQRAMER
jgi:hypothetical protein